MHGKWTEDEDVAIVALRLGTNLSWEGIKAKFDAAFPPASCKDLESRWNKTLRPTLPPRAANRTACLFDDYRHYRPSHIADGDQRRLVLAVLRVLADHPAERIVPPHPELESSGDQLQQAAAVQALQPSGSAAQLSAPPQPPSAPEQPPTVPALDAAGVSGQQLPGDSDPTTTTAPDSPLFVPQDDDNSVDAADSADNSSITANSTVAVDTQTYSQYFLLQQPVERSQPDQPMLDVNADAAASPSQQQPALQQQEPSLDLGVSDVNPNIDPQLYGYQ